jgi:hypothetical protein
MKKYFTGLIAIGCALMIGAFTKPFALYTFKLILDPNFGGSVHNDTNWSTGGTYWGVCVAPVNEIACEIKLGTTRTSYFHLVGGSQVLNSFAYAAGAVPKQDYLDILEGPGYMPERTITAINPKHWDSSTASYITVSLGADLSFKNGDY